MPFGPYEDFEACKHDQMAKGKSEEEANRICGELQHDLEVADIKVLTSETEVREAFEWVPNIERIKQYNKEGGHKGKLYAVKALHEGVTDPKNLGHGSRKYTAEELKRAARTLIGQPLNWNHTEPVKSGRNSVVDAEWSDEENAIEAIVYIEDSAAQEAIASKKVRFVSVQGGPRIVKTVDGASVPQGIVFDGLALVTEDQLPGDPKSSIRLIEVNRAEKSSLNQNASKQARKMPIKIEELKVYENLDAFLKALETVPDMPEEIKTQLATVAKQLYDQLGAQSAELKKATDSVTELKKTVASITELGKIKDDLKNLAGSLDELRGTVKELKEKPAGQGSVTETLTDDEKSTALKIAVRNTPLSEVVALAEA
jgi:hypothetical protein